MAKVFISYCGGDDDRGAWIRGELQERLKSEHEVFVDTSVISAGDRWRSLIYHWLAECRAAVVILGAAALSSEWVRREVNVLLWRASLCDVEIVPFLLGDTTKDDVRRAGFAELLDYQCVELPDGTDRPTCEEIVEAVAAGLAGVTDGDDDPMSEWISRIAFCLTDAQEHLRAAAIALGMRAAELPLLSEPAQGRRVFAQQMLARATDHRVYEAVVKLKRRIPDEQHRNLVEEVAPTWVDAAAARHLLTMGDNTAVVILNGTVEQTARHYIARATCRAVAG